MRTLHLLRHAKSSWDDESLADFDRPLNDRGRRACEALSTYFAEEAIAPDRILCSPARRTRETLAGVEAALDGPPAEFPDELYGADAETISALIAALPDDVATAMVIAHNPGIEEAALHLAGSGADLEAMRTKYPTGALATIEFEEEIWSEVTPNSGKLASFVKPRELG